jgi:hypothetical protein
MVLVMVGAAVAAGTTTAAAAVGARAVTSWCRTRIVQPDRGLSV